MSRFSHLGRASSRRRVGGNDGGDDGSGDLAGWTWQHRAHRAWDAPLRSELFASKYKVFAHYFLTFPIALQGDFTKDVDTTLSATTGKSVDTADYYDYKWMPLGAIEGGVDNRVFGGLVRDRHLLRRAKRTAVASPTKAGLTLSWQIQDRMHEVRDAIAADIDGFTLDVLQIPQPDTMPLRWRQLLWLFDAAAEVVRQDKVPFKIALMPDGSTSATTDPTTLASAMKYLVDNYPTIVYYHENSFALMPYGPELAPANRNSTRNADATYTAPAFWKEVLRQLRDVHKIPTILWNCHTRLWTGTQGNPDFHTIAYGTSRWGDRDPASSSAEHQNNRRAYYHLLKTWPTDKQKWMHPVSVGDERPNDTHRPVRFWERDHFRQLRESWLAAIGDPNKKDADGALLNRKADLVQIPTWSDIAEHAHICPSENFGYTQLDICNYYLIWYKTGVPPVIKRDAVYLSHRLQPTTDEPNTTVKYSSTYVDYPNRLMERAGSQTEQNTIGATCFFKAGDNTLTFNVGGTVITRTVGAGYQFVAVPMVNGGSIGTGVITLTVTRGGTQIVKLTTGDAKKVRLELISQDMGYRAVGNLR